MPPTYNKKDRVGYRRADLDAVSGTLMGGLVAGFTANDTNDLLRSIVGGIVGFIVATVLLRLRADSRRPSRRGTRRIVFRDSLGLDWTRTDVGWSTCNRASAQARSVTTSPVELRSLTGPSSYFGDQYYSAMADSIFAVMELEAYSWGVRTALRHVTRGDGSPFEP